MERRLPDIIVDYVRRIFHAMYIWLTHPHARNICKYGEEHGQYLLLSFVTCQMPLCSASGMLGVMCSGCRKGELGADNFAMWTQMFLQLCLVQHTFETSKHFGLNVVCRNWLPLPHGHYQSAYFNQSKGTFNSTEEIRWVNNQTINQA